jgi:ABC-2 type transport system ATP-binding protein
VGTGVLHVRLLDPGRRSVAASLLIDELRASVDLASDPAVLTARVAEVDRVAPALAALSRSGLVFTEFALGQPSLDEVFLTLTGRPVEADQAADEADEEEAA